MIEPGRYVRTPDGVGKLLTTNAGLLPPEQATTGTVTLYVGGPQLTKRGLRTYAISDLTDLGTSALRAKIEATLDRYEAIGPDDHAAAIALLDQLIADMRMLALEAS